MPLDNHMGTFLVTIMIAVIAIFIALCLFIVSKEIRHTCCQLMNFPGYTRWGWFIGFKLGALYAEKLEKEVRCDFETEREQDFLDTEFAGLVQLGIPEEVKCLLLMAFIKLSLLGFLFPLCRETKQIQVQV